jgi:hypothetical protein
MTLDGLPMDHKNLFATPFTGSGPIPVEKAKAYSPEKA